MTDQRMPDPLPRGRPSAGRGARRSPACGAVLGQLAVALAVAIVLGGCARHELLWVPDRSLNADLQELRGELERTDPGAGTADRRYALVAEIARTLRRGGEGGRERTFLTLYAGQHPGDPYNAAHLVTVADSYLEAGQAPVAVHYYRRALRNLPDLEVRGRSLHRHCLERLIELDDAVRHVEYYRELVERFPERVDLGLSLYRLAEAYARWGDWEQGLEAYGRFLRAPPTEIPGEPDAYRRVSELISFHHSDKSWVRDDLETLVAEARAAIAGRDVRALRRLQADVNFFATSWGSDATLTRRFRLEAFSMRRVYADAELHPDSNDREAFLRTAGWTARVTTWYFYFRRIDYGVDPRVDGTWEWAGIFFGEKL